MGGATRFERPARRLRRRSSGPSTTGHPREADELASNGLGSAETEHPPQLCHRDLFGQDLLDLLQAEAEVAQSDDAVQLFRLPDVVAPITARRVYPIGP